MLVRVHRRPVFDFPFERDLDTLFDSLLGGTEQVTYPRVDVSEEADRYLMSVELPGIMREDVKVSVQDGYLTLSGERRASTRPENAGWIRNEIRVGEFKRTLPLPGEVNVDDIAATLKDGILIVTLPKSETTRAREISVQ